MIPKELNWNHPLSQATLTALCIPCAGYGAAKPPGVAEYSPNQGNYLEIRLDQRLCPATSQENVPLGRDLG